MPVDVEYTDEFAEWWSDLTGDEQESVDASVQLLEAKGVALGSPHSSSVLGAKLGHLRELRVQHGGNPYRVFYAFDSRRIAILLIGGCKVGDDRFYEIYVPRAVAIYESHLAELRSAQK